MEFKYDATTSEGRAVAGVLEAGSETAAEQMLWDAGLVILSLKRSLKLPKAHQILPSVFGVSRKDVIVFSRNLASLLDAGIPLLRGLSILSRHGKESFKEVLRDVIRDLEEGASFSEACAKFPGVFPKFYVFLLKTGEEIGNLGSVLKETAAHMEKEEATKAKVKKSLAYPMFVVVLAVVAVIVMLGFVVPKLTEMFDEFGGEIPPTTALLVALGDFFGAYVMYMLVGLIVSVVSLVLYIKTKRGKRAKDMFLMKVPILGGAILKSSLSRFTRNIGMLVGAGVTLYEALELTGETTDNTVVADAIERIRNNVRDGMLFSEAMAAEPIVPLLLSELVGIGEETGNLENQLTKVSHFYEEEAEAAVSKVTGMLTPALTVGTGLMIGFLAVAMFSSIYGMADVIE